MMIKCIVSVQSTRSAQRGSVVAESSQDAHMTNTAGTVVQEYAECYSGWHHPDNNMFWQFK